MTITIPTAIRPRSPKRRFRSLAWASALSMLLAPIVAGCGATPDRNAPVGTEVVQDGVTYSVQTSRELNPFASDDRALFAGLPPRKQRLDEPGTVLVGVFLQARNDGSKVRRAVPAPRMVSAEGDLFRPLRLPAGDSFAYRGGRLAPHGEFPDPISNPAESRSAPAESPDDGGVLVYRVPDNTFLSDGPFTLRFGASDRAASVQLDV